LIPNTDIEIMDRNMRRFKNFCLKKEKCEYSFITRSNRSRSKSLILNSYMKVCYFSSGCNNKTNKIVRVKEGRV